MPQSMVKQPKPVWDKHRDAFSPDALSKSAFALNFKQEARPESKKLRNSPFICPKIHLPILCRHTHANTNINVISSDHFMSLAFT